MLTLVLVVLFVMMLASAPRWGHSRDWGYFPSGGLGLLLLVLVILMLAGRI